MRTISGLLLLLAAAWCVPSLAGSPPGTGDAEIAALLHKSVEGPQDRLEYVQECERAVAKYPETSLKVDLYRRIGDVYLLLGRFPEMETWYRRALAIDPSLEKSTSIGFQLNEYSRIKLNKLGKLAAKLLLVGIACMMLLHGVKDRRLFDWRFCLLKGAAFLLLFALAAATVLIVDGHAAARWLLSLSTGEAGNRVMVRPLIPLSMVDASRAGRAAVILLSGILPILVAVFYTSFRRPLSRKLLSLIVILVIGSLWTHFYFAHVSDPLRKDGGFIRKGTLYLRDEPEDLLVKDLPKALRANPDLLKSDNDDLKEFMKEHYPGGVGK